MGRWFANVVGSMACGLLATALCAPAVAQEPGEEVEGVIAEVDGRSITVDREGGGRVTARLGGRTHVVVHPRQGGHYPNASAEFLKPGMGVRFKYAAGPLDRVHVTSVPPGAWPQAEPHRPAGGLQPSGDAHRADEPETLVKVRITDISSRGDEFTADVAGRRQVYRTASGGLLRRFAEGDLVILALDDRNRVVDVRPATLSGRVTRVDHRSGRVTVDVDGRDESYTVDDRGLLDDVERGDRIRFEVEERGSRQVITAIF